jgi:hypothetical protein
MFEARAQRLNADALEAGIFSHRGVRGTVREEILAAALRDVLPREWAVGTGQLHDATGKSAGQADVVIYDASATPVLHGRTTQTLFPVESAYAVVSVKSKMNAAGVRQGFDMAGQALGLARFPVSAASSAGGPPLTAAPVPTPPRPATFVFAFGGVSGNAVVKQANATLAKGSGASPHGFCVNRTAYAFPIDGGGSPQREVKGMAKYSHRGDGDGSFGNFVVHLLGVLSASTREEPLLAAYIREGLLALGL